MAKNFLNDIRPADRDERRTRLATDDQVEESVRPTQLPPRFRERSYADAGSRGSKSRKIIWIIAVLVVIGGGIAVATYFASAKVTVVQKTEDINLDSSVSTATLSGENDTLSFKLVKLTGSAEKVVTGGTPTTVMTKATGKVIIFNNFSNKPQNFAVETRLVGPDGKIFKTDTAVVVPGFTTKDGKQTPGQLEVGVHADLPGSAYNIGLSDFTILGFKGTPKYTKFTVRSKTVMAGGASGQGIALTEADAKIAHEAALGVLEQKLIAQTKTSLPDTSILLPGAYVIHEDPDSGQTVAEKSVMIVKGSMYGILFDRAEFTQKIANMAVGKLDQTVTIPELSTFNIDLKNAETITDTTSSISFAISGKGHIVWQVPEQQMLNILAGSKKSDISMTLANFPSVEKASVNVKPFWIIRLPSKQESIHLVVVDPTAAK